MTTSARGRSSASTSAKHFAGKKIGYFYQDDEFGMDGVKGLDYEIPKSMVVARQTYVPTNVNIAPAVAALHAAGAQVVVSFSIPAFTALLKLNSLKLGYSPTLVVSNVGSDAITLSGLLESFAKQGGATVNGNQLTAGIITDGYLPTLGDTSNSWIALFKKMHDTYDAKAPFDGNVLYGEAVAYTFVQAMLKAGRNPTRADLVNAINAGLPQGPAVAPYAYSSTDHDGVTGAYIGIINNGVLTQQGPVLTTDTSASGAITTVTAEPAGGASERHSVALISVEHGMTTDERPPARAPAGGRRGALRRAQLQPHRGRGHLRQGRDGDRQLLRVLRLQGGDLRRGRPGYQRGPAERHEGGPGKDGRRPANAGARMLPRLLRDGVEASLDGPDRARIGIRRTRPVP